MIDDVDALSGLLLCAFGYNSEMDPLNADKILSFEEISVTVEGRHNGSMSAR
jgi:hypothetical protein